MVGFTDGKNGGSHCNIYHACRIFAGSSLTVCCFLYLAAYYHVNPVTPREQKIISSTRKEEQKLPESITREEQIKFTEELPVETEDYSKVDCRKIVCNIRQLLFHCLNHNAIFVLSQIKFVNVDVLPLDVDVSYCVLHNALGKSDNKSDIIKFGLIPTESSSSVKSLFDIVNIGNDTRVKRFFELDNVIMLKYDNMFVELILLLDKGDYFQGTDILFHKVKSNNFAFPKFHFQYVRVDNFTFLYPLDIQWFYKNLNGAKLLLCNHSLALSLREEFPEFYNGKRRLTDKDFNYFVQLRDLLYSLRMLPILVSGSLLGWLRECGLIQYTTDFDIAVRASEYNEYFETVIKHHKDFRFENRFNRLNDSLEYAIRSPSNVKTDLFILYQETNHSYYGGIGPERTKLKWTFPPLQEICSADLLGYLFHIPCNPYDYVIADFGPNWTRPVHDDDFKWYKSSFAVAAVKTYTEEEWKEIVTYL